MSQTKEDYINNYKGVYLQNNKVEWLGNNGKIRESVYFKGATGDRYTIYIATRRNKNVIDIGTVFNSLDHGTSLGT